MITVSKYSFSCAARRDRWHSCLAHRCGDERRITSKADSKPNVLVFGLRPAAAPQTTLQRGDEVVVTSAGIHMSGWRSCSRSELVPRAPSSKRPRPQAGRTGACPSDEKTVGYPNSSNEHKILHVSAVLFITEIQKLRALPRKDDRGIKERSFRTNKSPTLHRPK